MSNELQPELRESLRAILLSEQVGLIVWQMGFLDDAEEILEWLDRQASA